MYSRSKKMFEEPHMSDATLLVSVEDLISIGLGPDDKNIVNFKVVQTVLHILARQQRLLQQKVEIRISELIHESPPAPARGRKPKKSKESDASSRSPSPTPKKRAKEVKSKDADKAEKDSKQKEEKEKAKLERDRERELKAQQREKEKVEKSAMKEQDRAAKVGQKELERALKEKEKAVRAAEKAERATSKDREKADRAASKEREKAERAASKEREKVERATSKEREKAERATSKDREKAEKAAEKERERAERAASKDREKAERAASKDRDKAERAAEKDREKAGKEKERAARAEEKEKEKAEKADRKDRERADKESAKKEIKEDKKKKMKAAPSISVSEVERGKEKVLVVEKGPTTRSDHRGRDSIDVVTQSQFALLEATVKGLMQKAAPMAELRLPDNQQLKSALVKGSASLTDTMQAMQVDARMKAAEAAIDRMAGLLTQLAAAGAVPEELADKVAEAKREAERTLTSDTDDVLTPKPRPATARKSVAIDPMVKASTVPLARPSTARASSVPTPRASVSTVMGVVSQPSSTVTTVPEPKVTRSEMQDIIASVKEDLFKKMNTMTQKATASAETAMHTAKSVADKLEVALKLDTRISSLHSLVADYAEQLSGFDAGLTTQMQSFQEQIMQIRGDLTAGLKLLETVNNNAETAAVMELKERYLELVQELERTTTAHRALNDFQSQLGDELRSLVECVEMLREQKADRDEVIDGLRDKADTSRLAGLLTEAEFALSRADLNRRLDVCHDKFRRQDGVWMGAIKDLLMTTDRKAEIIDVLSMKDNTQWQLRELQAKLRLLAAALGEPQAALLTRQLARGATCGACGVAALMGMRDPAQGKPPAFPALRPPPPADQPCLARLDDWMTTDTVDDRHICLRWVGGSHTLVSERTTREEAPPLRLQETPTRKYADYGRDGRLYMLEEELQPCVECNVILEEKLAGEPPERPPPVGEEGDGPQGPTQSTTS